MPTRKSRQKGDQAEKQAAGITENLPGDGIFVAGVAPPSSFNEYSKEMFESWLRVGLEGFLLEGEDIWAFPGAETILAGPEPFIKKLGNFYRALASQQRARFRQATADLLAILPSQERFVPVFEYLLALALEIRAYEILPVLPRQVGSGFFGLTDQRDGESLFVQTLLTVIQLAAPRSDALNCILRLMGSDHFDHAYAGVTLTALCYCDGANLVPHIERMRTPLDAMFREFSTGQAGKRVLATSILEAVGIHPVVSALPHLTYFNKEREDAPLDLWFLDALLTGDAPLLICEETEHRWFRFLNSMNMKSEELFPREGPGMPDLIDYIHRKRLVRNIYPSAAVINEYFLHITPRDSSSGRFIHAWFPQVRIGSAPSSLGATS
ncbi:MAG: hypothetical protein HW380_279 [Magnetococcales bacterium]|nr:hypothetical protein [Magnetococcales bacterium]HIJ83300.1 hypothetical protein [Magnetococcales bacterium]